MRIVGFLISAMGWFTCCTVNADTFGSDPNTMFEIEFVAIRDANNPDGTTREGDPVGKVEYAFRMGKYEVSRDMIARANLEGALGITLDDMAFVTNGPRKDMPATSVSWFEAALFVNWLNDQKGASPAYKFNGNTFELWQSGDAGYDQANPFRNTRAYYFLPSADEWHKAAYYDPSASVYFDFPTGSNARPLAITGGTDPNTAVYSQLIDQGPADITRAGGLSPYGTMGQGGNVVEWEETAGNFANDSSLSDRGFRGGFWGGSSSSLNSLVRPDLDPTNEGRVIGFRVASIPEPTTSALALAALCLAMGRRRTF